MKQFPFVLDNRLFTTYNNGICCTSDNVIHHACFVSTGATNNVSLPDWYNGWLLPGHEEGFEITECQTRCLNDQLCRGFSIFTTTDNNKRLERTVTFDTCVLFTTTNATSLCTLDFLRNPEILLSHSEWSTGPLDPNATCLPRGPDGSGGFYEFTRYNYNDGCYIRTDQDNLVTSVNVQTSTSMNEETTSTDYESGKYNFKYHLIMPELL